MFLYAIELCQWKQDRMVLINTFDQTFHHLWRHTRKRTLTPIRYNR